jgi:predicted HTH domain antitoxin
MKIELTIPDTAIDMPEGDVKLLLAGTLFERGLLDSGYAAKSIGISREQFLEKVGKFDVPIFQYTANDIRRDVYA